jgi:hypothetical protein
MFSINLPRLSIKQKSFWETDRLLKSEFGDSLPTLESLVAIKFPDEAALLELFQV